MLQLVPLVFQLLLGPYLRRAWLAAQTETIHAIKSFELAPRVILSFLEPKIQDLVGVLGFQGVVSIPHGSTTKDVVVHL